EANPRIDPTDRSMPAVRITSVTPTARIPREPNAPTALVMFVWFRKTSPLVAMPSAITMTSPMYPWSDPSAGSQRARRPGAFAASAMPPSAIREHDLALHRGGQDRLLGGLRAVGGVAVELT